MHEIVYRVFSYELCHQLAVVNGETVIIVIVVLFQCKSPRGGL
jgi:hypothetical protein